MRGPLLLAGRDSAHSFRPAAPAAANRSLSRGTTRASCALLRLSVACVAASTLTSPGSARGQVEDRLADCARIAGSSERLECYDALSKARSNSAATQDFWNRAMSPTEPHGAAAAREPADTADTVTEFGFNDARSVDGAQQVQS